MDNFKPNVIGFLCRWCSYAGADLAGIDRMHYPPNVRVIRVMCSGRIDPLFVLEAFKLGIDGILIMGCHPEECHHVSGNLKALRRVTLLKKLMEQLGLNPKRLRLDWISANEGGKFAEVSAEMVDEIKKIGPNPLKEGIR